jgi:hypothetical protein
VVDRTRLESGLTFTGNGSSNLPLSASYQNFLSNFARIITQALGADKCPYPAIGYRSACAGPCEALGPGADFFKCLSYHAR